MGIGTFSAAYALLGFLSMRRYVWHINGKWTYDSGGMGWSSDYHKFGLARSLAVSFLGAIFWPFVNGFVAIRYMVNASRGTVGRSIMANIMGALGRGFATGFKRLMISEPYHAKQKRRIAELESRLAER